MTISDGLRWIATIVVAVIVVLAFIMIIRPRCNYLIERVASYEACKIDMNCRLTAKDHYEWIRFQKELESCHDSR